MGRRTGRPASKERREAAIKASLTAAEHAAVVAAAEREGLPPALWARRVLLAAAKPPAP